MTVSAPARCGFPFTGAILTAVFLFAILPIHAASRGKTHSFKIVGKSDVPQRDLFGIWRTVEYDSLSADHLYFNEYYNSGKIKTKTCLLYKGKLFWLEELSSYRYYKRVLIDGPQINYREDGAPESEFLYKNEILIQQTFFYPDGKKQMSFGGDNEILNGEFKTWYPDGQLSFVGYYRNNLKNGDFQQFNPDGTIYQEGRYVDGVLISGTPVVIDMLYEKPEVAAHFAGGDQAFNDYLKEKTGNFPGFEMDSTKAKLIVIDLTIEKDGNISKKNIRNETTLIEKRIVNAAFLQIPSFVPATVEGIPVCSSLELDLILTSKGLKMYYDDYSDYFDESVDEMPKFASGPMGLLLFIKTHIRYPNDALKIGFSGIVPVRFVIDENGFVTEAEVVKSVRPDMDAEAVRLIKSLPRWTPARKNGTPVRITFMIRVLFDPK